jgi:hypothetical protein
MEAAPLQKSTRPPADCQRKRVRQDFLAILEAFVTLSEAKGLAVFCAVCCGTPDASAP